MNSVWIEQYALNVGKIRLGQNFGKIVNKKGAAAPGDALQFGRSCQLEKNRVPRQADAHRVKKAVLFEPIQSRLVEIARRAHDRLPGFVADDAQANARTAALLEEFQRSRISHRLGQTRPIDQSLKFRPCVFPSRPSQMFADGGFAGREAGRDVPPFERHAMEKRVVADDSIVKINADMHF